MFKARLFAWRHKGAVALAGGVLLLAAVAGLSSTGSPYLQGLTNLALIYAVIVLGLNITLGLTGLIDLSIPGFVGIGAYTVAIFAGTFGWPLWSAVVLALLLAALVSAVFGVPTLRLKTHYFAFATLGFAAVAHLIFINEGQLTGGSTGFSGIPRPSIGDQPLSLTAMTWLLVAVLSVVVVAATTVDRSRFGKRLRAIKEDALAAELIGIPVALTRLAAFIVASMLYALGGVLYAFEFGFVSPEVFTLHLTVLVFAMLVVGGSGAVAGAVFGAFLFVFLPHWARFMGTAYPSVYGSLMVVFLIVMPMGIVPFAWSHRAHVSDRLFGRLRRMEASAPAGATTAPPAKPISIASTTPPGVIGGAVILQVDGISLNFGGLRALDHVALDVRQGELHAVIGPNGAGKTSLINCVTGAYHPDSGSITLAGARINGMRPHRIVERGVARTFQTLRLFGELTVRDNLQIGAWPNDRPRGGRESEWARWVDRFELGPLLDRPASALSFGERRRLEIARALATAPRLVLLDEPASGLAPSEVEALGRSLRWLRAEGVALLLVEHNMPFVMGIADDITVLHFGKVIAQGKSDEIRANPDVIEAYLGREEDGA